MERIKKNNKKSKKFIVYIFTTLGALWGISAIVLSFVFFLEKEPTGFFLNLLLLPITISGLIIFKPLHILRHIIGLKGIFIDIVNLTSVLSTIPIGALSGFFVGKIIQWLLMSKQE